MKQTGKYLLWGVDVIHNRPYWTRRTFNLTQYKEVNVWATGTTDFLYDHVT